MTAKIGGGEWGRKRGRPETREGTRREGGSAHYFVALIFSSKRIGLRICGDAREARVESGGGERNSRGVDGWLIAYIRLVRLDDSAIRHHFVCERVGAGRRYVRKRTQLAAASASGAS